MCSAWWNVINVGQIRIGGRGGICFRMFDWRVADKFLRGYLTSLVLFVRFGGEWNTSVSKSQKSGAGIPSMRKNASRKITSASVELSETVVCFRHIHLTGTEVWLPKMHNVPPDVDFESSRSPAKKSWNNHNLHCCAVFPTKIFPVFACMVNVRYRKRQTFVTNCPFRDRTSNFVYRPKYQVSQYKPNTSMSEQFVSKLWTCPAKKVWRMSINSIQLSEINFFKKPLNLPLPGFNKIVSHLSKTEYRAGEGVGFGNGITISSTVQ